MARPYVSFAEVKEKVCLVEDVLPEFGLENHFQRRGKSLVGVCPMPDHLHGPSPNKTQFRIDLAPNGNYHVYYCFGDCSAADRGGGDCVEFIKRMTQLDDAHVRFWIAERWGNRLNLTRPSNGKKRDLKKTRRRSSPKKEKACDEGSNQTSQASVKFATEIVPELPEPLKPLSFTLRLDSDVEYLRGRGVSDDTVKRYGLGICRKGMFKGYIAMPIYDDRLGKDSNPVSYLGRWPGEDYDQQERPRYLLPVDFPKSQILFGLRQALGDSEEKALQVVEGPFGVFSLVQAGYPAVAVLGSSLSDEQAAILISVRRRIVLMFDGDTAGTNGMGQAAGKLIKHTWTRVITLPESSQPDHLTSEQLKGLLGSTS